MAAAMLKGRNVIERKVVIVPLFANASDYSNKTCIYRCMCLYLTKYASLVGVVTCVREERYERDVTCNESIRYVISETECKCSFATFPLSLVPPGLSRQSDSLTMASLTLAQCYLVAVLVQVPAVLGKLSITANSSRLNDSYMYSEGTMFDGPYANLNSQITGSLYNNTNYDCTQLTPLDKVNDSAILLINNYSECILEKINFAQQAGYAMLLTYTDDDSNFTITNSVSGTKFPVAVIEVYFAEQLSANISVRTPNDSSYINVQGSVVSGVILISFIVIFFISFVCCCFIWVLICCKLYCEENQMEREMHWYEAHRGDHPSREELIESIMRHLHQLEQDMGSQTPLGMDRTHNLRMRRYKGTRERDTTCVICVEDYRIGERVKELPCRHIFHPLCIDEWLNNHSSLCPLCKVNLRTAVAEDRLSDSGDDASSIGGSRTTLTSSSGVDKYGAVSSIR